MTHVLRVEDVTMNANTAPLIKLEDLKKVSP
jgi:hypothetical protein